jgi:hypothetical protein
MGRFAERSSNHSPTEKDICMKKILQGICVVVLLASLGLAGLAGCGGNDPKALAKQSYELIMELKDTLSNGNFIKAAELTEKENKLKEQVAKLSDADKKIFAQEARRLMGDFFGLLDLDPEPDNE